MLISDSNTYNPQVYRMSTSCSDDLNTSIATITEIKNDYTFLGSGKDVAESIYTILCEKRELPHNVFLLTKKIISACISNAKSLDKNSDVGGDLQAGFLNGNGFEVLGIQDFHESPNFGDFFKYCFGGMIMHDDFSLPFGINIKRRFLKIYNEDDIKQKIEENFNYRHPQ